MKKMLFAFVIFLLVVLTLYPCLEFTKDGYLYIATYSKEWDKSKDYEQLEEETCYDESYSYNKKRNISIISWDYNEFLIFRWFKIKYKKGNICASEFILDESYITNFIENAIINEGSDNVDLATLIENKKAIIKNKRYEWNDEHKYINYILDGKYEEMYIYYNDEGLLIIQVGLSDEGPKYIAYK